MPGSVRAASAIARAMPKSATFTRPSRVTRMLPGLMSRWTKPFSWAAAIAWATSAVRRAAWRGGRAPLRRMIEARSSPSTSSMTMNGPTVSVP